MAYRVKGASFDIYTSGGAPALVLDAGTARQVQTAARGWQTAGLSSGTTSGRLVFDTGFSVGSGAYTTLSDAAPGISVVTVTSGNVWQQGTLMNDGATYYTTAGVFSGVQTAVTYTPGGVTPTGNLTQQATASGATTWFTDERGQRFHGSAPTTLGALSGGYALVQLASGGKWQAIVV